MVISVLNAKNHYQVLCIEKDADEGEIKSAHRKMALRLHPDKVRLTSDKDRQKAERAFRGVQMAYEILSKPHSRKMYDLEQRMSTKDAKQFVPGESGGDAPSGDDEETPTIGMFFSMVLQIALAVVVHVCVQVFSDCGNIFKSDARGLHVAISVFFSFYFIPFLQLGFWTSLLYAFLGYSVHKIVPPQYWAQLWELQLAHWNKRSGLPFYVMLLGGVYHWGFCGATVPAAAAGGFMAGATVLLSVLMPQMTFGNDSFFVGVALAAFSLYYLSLDLHFALFMGICAWHFLQSLPAVCLSLLAMVVLYILWKLSAVLILLILSLCMVFIPTDNLLLVAASVVASLTCLYIDTWTSTFLYLVGTWGVRQTFSMGSCGKRAFISALLVWCLDYGFLASCAFVVAIFIAGEFLLAVFRSEAESDHVAGAYGASHPPPPPNGSPPGSGGAAGSNKKKNKGRFKH